MKKSFLIALLLVLSIFYTYTGHYRAINAVPDKENGTNVFRFTNSFPTYASSVVLDTSGSVSSLSNWYDYRTNGNNCRGIWVLGDTIIIACDMTDSANSIVSTARNSFYNVSTNGGVTWSSDALQVSTFGNAYPDVSPVFISGFRSVAFSGRQFDNNARGAYAGSDIQLGAGSITTLLIPGAQDNFTYLMSATELACGFENRATDSLFFAKYNFITNTVSGKLKLASGLSEGVEANTRSYTAATTDGKVAIAWWGPTNFEMLIKTSTNSGSSFGSTTTILNATSIVGGDSVISWFGTDLLYSPAGNVCLATNTLPPTFVDSKGYKLVFWSPTVNGGNPVIIADYSKPNLGMINDSTYFNANYTSARHQTGYTPISHPSLAYSSDGTRLFCVYTGVQKDTASYGHYFNDVYVSYSDNNGSTWSNPTRLTNTAAGDEIYPIISKTGCSPSNIAITYQLSECPGSASFTSTTNPSPICRVYNIFKRFNPVTGAEIPIGITNISNEVPEAFTLKQNYPNPFNPTTKIRFTVPKSSSITIEVFDITGRLVSVLANNEFVTPGTKEVDFNATNLSSGIYFYKLTAGEFTATRKMMLVK